MYISSVSNYGIMNAMKTNQIAIAKSNERLSTGQKLSSDSPVDVGIVSRLESSIRSGEAQQRINEDSISFIQTANEGLDHVSELLTKLKELSSQYGRETLSATDKQAILDSAKELGTELSSVLKNVNFNGKPVFKDGELNLNIGQSKISVSLNDLVNNVEKATNSTIDQAVDTVSDIVNNITLSGNEIALVAQTPTTRSAISAHSLPIVSNITLTSSSVETATVTAIATPNAAKLASTISNEGEGYYDIPNANIVLPDQKGYTGFKKIVDDKGKLIYEGNLTNGIADGYGKYYENGKIVYEGDFDNGVYDGFGTIYGDNGKVVYRGDIKDGEAHGWGTYYGTNGKSLYEGGFKEGYRDGWGTTYDTNGKRIESKMYSDYNNRPTEVLPPATGGNGGSGGTGNTGDSGNTGGAGNGNGGGTGGTGGVGDNGGTGNGGDTGNSGGTGGTGGIGGGNNSGDTGNTGDSGSGSGTGGTGGSGGTGNTGGTGGTGNSGGSGGTTLPDLPEIDLGDLGSLDPDDLLNGDLLDKIQEGLNEAKSKLGITEYILERRISFQAEQNRIQEEMKERIQSIDMTKELAQKAKQEMLLQMNSFLFTQNIERQRSMMTTLLSAL